MFSLMRDADENMQTDAANNPQVDEAEEATTLERLDKEQKNRSTSSEDPNIQTFGKALKLFGLYPRLQDIERSLEEVRRRRKSREHHELELKKFDKEILRLCQKHHPDRVKNRGGSDEEMETAKNLQASLNAVRTVMNILNKTFLDNIDVDHMYGFYTNLSINSAGNEDEIRDHVYEVFFKISYVSEIKNQNIIPEIRKFLAAGKECLKSFLDDNVPDFMKYRDVALSHLKTCIAGHIKLKSELESLRKEIKDKSLVNILELLTKMSDESDKNLSTLREIQNVVKKSLNGTCRIFISEEPTDKYFVLPFLRYINAINMCNAMFANKIQTFLGHCWNKVLNIIISSISRSVFTSAIHNPTVYLNLFASHLAWPKGERYLRKIITQHIFQPEISGNPSTDPVMYAYSLAICFAGIGYSEKIFKEEIKIGCWDKEKVVKAFRECLQKIEEDMEETFRLENYIEGNCRNGVEDEWAECMRLMAAYEDEEKKAREDMENLWKKHQELEERLQSECRSYSNGAESHQEEDKLNEEKHLHRPQSRIELI